MFHKKIKRKEEHTPLEEELHENIDSEMSGGFKILVIEAPNNEQDCQDDETSELNGFASNGINGSNCHPVSRNSSGTDQDTVTSSQVVKDSVDGIA